MSGYSEEWLALQNARKWRQQVGPYVETVARVPTAIVQEARKPSKYRNEKTTIDGETFDSAGEAKRYQELKMLERAGQIRGLRRQVDFSLHVNGMHICIYRADFMYEEKATGWTWTKVVEDYKGYPNEVYPLKKKLMLACHGIAIRECGRAAA